MEKITKASMKQAICDKLRLNFGCAVEEATEEKLQTALRELLEEFC